MAQVRITSEPRTEFGKGAARRIRRADKVPAILYGHGTETRHLTLPGHDLMLALKGGANTLLEVQIDGTSELALPKMVVRDPIKGFFEHIDLLLVRRGEKVTVDVPITLVGDAAPETIVDLQQTTLSVEAEATNIPAGLEVSIEGLTVGASIPASQVQLPAGTTLVADPDSVVVHVMAQVSAEALEADLAAPEAEGAETEAAPEGAPAGTVAEPTPEGPPAEEQAPTE
ncbi:MAG: 50S ribosomal protein L25/general stress protein Ctc [Actinomycetes bacterium]